MKRSPNVDEIEDQAAAWILKRESPSWSAEDQAQLEEWLRASTSRRVAYVRLRAMWKEADRLRVVGAGAPRGEVPARGEIGRSPFFAGLRTSLCATQHSVQAPPSSPAKSPPLRWPAVAAAAVLMLTGALAAYWWGSAPTYRTAVGGLATVPLEDGSKVTLNTNTEIIPAINDTERRVTLKRGEAFFDVARDPLRPFVVHAGGRRVEAVGTKFAVRLKSDEVQVLVTEGQVRLDKHPSLLLTPGTVARATDERVDVQQEPLEEVEQVLSWRSGYVVLRKTLLSEAVEEFNRYNRRQLILADPSLGEVRVGGNFRSDNLDGFVRLLQEGFAVRAEARGNRILLIRADDAMEPQGQ